MPKTPSAAHRSSARTPCRPPRGRAAGSQRGVTLTESTVVLGIIAILLGATVPGFGELRLRRQMEGVAAQLETDIQLARSEAVSRHETVRIDFASDDTGSCYVLHDGGAGDCRCDGSGAFLCSEGARPLRTVSVPATQPLRLRSTSASIAFDADQGTVTPTTSVRVRSAAGEIRQIVNVMGRVRSCSPDGVPGYRRC